MNSTLRKSLQINTTIVFLVVIGAAIFDYSLQLGDFHGLVLILFTYYGMAAIAIINIIIAAFYLRKNKTIAKHIALGGLIPPLSIALITYVIATVIQ